MSNYEGLLRETLSTLCDKCVIAEKVGVDYIYKCRLCGVKSPMNYDGFGSLHSDTCPVTKAMRVLTSAPAPD